MSGPVGGTGRWRCRGLVGGDVGGDWSEDWSVHPWGMTLWTGRRRCRTGRRTGRWHVGGTGRRRRGLVGGLVGPPCGDAGDRSAAMPGPEDWSVAMSGTVRRRRGLVETGRSTRGGDVGGPVGGDVRPVATGGDVGGWSAATGTGRGSVGPPVAATLVTGGDVGDRGGPVGGDVGGLVGGDAGDRSEDWSTRWRRVGGLVGGDAGGDW
jgi:hypothetical protein